MLPFELVATATASPRDSPGGSLRKFGTEVNGMSGTPVIVAFCWATAEPATSRKAAEHAETRDRVIGGPLSRVDRMPCGAYTLFTNRYKRELSVLWCPHRAPQSRSVGQRDPADRSGSVRQEFWSFLRVLRG